MEDSDEFDLEEARRRVDHQTETIRKKRQQAAQVIGALITVLTASLSFAIGFSGRFDIQDIPLSGPVAPTDSLSWYVAEIKFLTEPAAALFFLILFLTLPIYIGEAASQLLSGVYSSVQILKPQKIASGLRTGTIRNRLQNGDDSIVERRTKSDYRDEYRHALETNEQLLSTAISRWEDVHRGFLRGVLAAVMVVIILCAVNFKAPVFLFLGVALPILHSVIWLASEVGVDTLRGTFIVFPRVDLVVFLSIAYTLFLQDYPTEPSSAELAIGLSGIAIVLAVSVYSGLQMDRKVVPTVLVRNIILCLSIFIGLIMTGAPVGDGLSPTVAFGILVVSLLYQLVLVLIWGVIYLIRKTIVRITSWWQSLMTRSRRAFVRGHWSSTQSGEGE